MLPTLFSTQIKKLSPIQATVKKFNSIPAETSMFCGFHPCSCVGLRSNSGNSCIHDDANCDVRSFSPVLCVICLYEINLLSKSEDITDPKKFYK